MQNYLCWLGQCGQKWLVTFLVYDLNFAYQLKEESGSAEEQPVSNRADAKR